MTIDVSSAKLLKYLQLALLVAVFILALWSQPWKPNTIEKARTISVSGQATVEAVPDEFTFYPRYQKVGTNDGNDEEELLTAVNTTIEELIVLGVPSENITLNANSLDLLYREEGQEGVISVSLEIVVPAGDSVQDVQDYLLTTGAKGQITPQATFSESMLSELETEATVKASEDARTKAEAQATLFGAELGHVITIDQSNGFSGGYPEPYFVESSSDDTVASPSLPVLPGKNDYTLTVNVTYELQ